MTQFSIATKEYVDEQVSFIDTYMNDNGLNTYDSDVVFSMTDEERDTLFADTYITKQYPLTTYNIPNQYYNIANQISSFNVGSIKTQISGIGTLYITRSFIDTGNISHYMGNVMIRNNDNIPSCATIDFYCQSDTLYMCIVIHN